MIPELGNFAVILALLVACIQAFCSLVGAARGNTVWMSVARPAAHALFLLVVVASRRKVTVAVSKSEDEQLHDLAHAHDDKEGSFVLSGQESLRLLSL